MKPLLVLYATREGQTRRVAAELVRVFQNAGRDARMFDLREHPEPDLADCAGIVLAASVHLGKHEREMIAFVKAHHAELERIPNAFVSVSLMEARVEDMEREEEDRARAASDVRAFVRGFIEETGWHPLRVKAVAGALRYSQYGRVVRFVMRHIAESSALDTDTSHDTEYTDWSDLDQFAAGFLALVQYGEQQGA